MFLLALTSQGCTQVEPEDSPARRWMARQPERRWFPPEPHQQYPRRSCPSPGTHSPLTARARDPEPCQPLKLRPDWLLCIQFLLSPPSHQVKYKVNSPSWAGTRRLAGHVGLGKAPGRLVCTDPVSILRSGRLSHQDLRIHPSIPPCPFSPIKTQEWAAAFQPLNSTALTFVSIRFWKFYFPSSFCSMWWLHTPCRGWVNGPAPRGSSPTSWVHPGGTSIPYLNLGGLLLAHRVKGF